MNWLSLATKIDGAMVAAALAVGQAVPAWAPVCAIVAQVAGVLGTILGGIHTLNFTSVRRAGK
jgi:hypothetical protein